MYNSPIQDYNYKDNHASPTYEVTPGFIPLIVLLCMLNATAIYTKRSSTAQSCVSTKEHGYHVKWKHRVLLLLSKTLARSSSSQKTVHVLWQRANPASRSSTSYTEESFLPTRFTSFLIALCRYQLSLQHLAGSANLPSDFASRNTSDRNAPLCVICSFILETENSVGILSVFFQDIKRMASIYHLPSGPHRLVSKMSTLIYATSAPTWNKDCLSKTVTHIKKT